MVEKHFNISITPVRSRGGSLVKDKKQSEEFDSIDIFCIARCAASTTKKRNCDVNYFQLA
jgi:hypothetical protein